MLVFFFCRIFCWVVMWLCWCFVVVVEVMLQEIDGSKRKNWSAVCGCATGARIIPPIAPKFQISPSLPLWATISMIKVYTVQEQVLVTFGPVLIQFVVCVFAGGLDLGQNHCRVWRLMRLSNGGGKLL